MTVLHLGPVQDGEKVEINDVGFVIHPDKSATLIYYPTNRKELIIPDSLQVNGECYHVTRAGCCLKAKSAYIICQEGIFAILIF